MTSRQANTSPTRSMIQVSVGGETYALEMSQVQGIHRTDRLAVDRGPGGQVGALHAGGGAVPVYGLAQRLGCPVLPPGGPQNVVVLHAEPSWGLLVDRVSQAMHVADGQFVPLPELVVPANGGYFRGVLTRSSGLMLVLDPAALSPFAQGAARERRAEKRGLMLPVPRANGAGQLVIFSTAVEEPGRRPVRFGLSVTQVAEVLDTQPTVNVPGAPGFVLGLMAWRQHPVAVIDLDRRVGKGGSQSAPTDRVLVAATPARDALIAFPVQSAIRTQRLPVAHLPCDRELPIDRAFTLGSFELKNETVSVLDLDRVIGRRSLAAAV